MISDKKTEFCLLLFEKYDYHIIIQQMKHIYSKT
jgi:hypothetical protein